MVKYSEHIAIVRIIVLTTLFLTAFPTLKTGGSFYFYNPYYLTNSDFDTRAETGYFTSGDFLPLVSFLLVKSHNFFTDFPGPAARYNTTGQAPLLQCPEDISTYTDINTCSSFVSGGLNPGFDEDEIVTLTWEMTGIIEDASPRSGINLIDYYTFDEGTTIITYNATARSGATASCTFTVTISDNQVPRLESIPGDITVETGPGECFAAVSWPEPTVIDNCTPQYLIVTEASHRPGDRFPTGTTTVSYIAYDAMGNTSQPATFTVTVTDGNPPGLHLPPDVTAQCGDPLPPAWQTLQQLTNAGGYATDDCRLDENSFRLISETPSSAICPFTLTRVYGISDVAGNTTTAEHRIFVEGEGIPQLPPPPAEPEAAEPEEPPQLKSAMALITAVQTGNWNDLTTWDCGDCLPSSIDDVVIPNGITVTINSNAETEDITIENGGTLTHSGSNTLQVYGSWLNNGTYNVSTNGTVEFTGTNQATIGGSSTTTFRRFTLSKTQSNVVVNITGNVRIQENLRTDVQLNSGILQAGTSGSISFIGNAGFTIGQNAGIIISGGTFTGGNFSVDNDGLFRISSGTASFGYSSGNSFAVRNSGTFEVIGGTVNIAGRLAVSGGTTTISGGTINLNTVGHSSSSVATLDMSLTSNFSMTAGTINFNRPNGSGYLDVSIKNSSGGSKSFTGGIFNFGNVIPGTFRMESVVGFPNYSVAANTDMTLRIPVTSNGTYNFPLITGTGNSIPATIQTTGESYSNAYIEITTYDTKHPNNANTTNYLNRYWVVTTTGITNPNYNINAGYLNSDITGSPSGFIAADYTSPVWNRITNHSIVSNTISVNGITQSNFIFSALSDVTVSITASDNPICYGATTQLTTTATGDPVFSYAWAPSAGLSSTTVANPTASPTATTTYTVTVTDGNGLTATDNIEITVYDQFNPGAIAIAGETICYGGTPETIIGSVTDASGGDGTTNYEWRSSANNYATAISGAINATYTPPAGLIATTTYRRYTTDGTCISSPVQSSGEWTVNVLPQFNAGAIAATGETICYNDNPITIGSTISASGGGGTITYEWRANGTPVPNSNSSTYTPPANLTTTTTYTRWATDGTCISTPVQSSGEWIVTVLPQLIAGSASSAQTICYGTAPMSLSATAATGGSGSFSYQWESSANGTSGWTAISGATGLVFSPPALTATTHYRIVYTDSGANACGSVESNPVQIDVRPELTASASYPDITCNNGTTTVTLSAAGGTPPYSYVFNGVASSNGVINNVSEGTYSWSVTDALGCGPVEGEITILQPDLVTITSAEVTADITCYGGTAIVNITANGGTGDLSYTFNGQTNTTGIFTGVYAGTNRQYSVTDANGCGPVNGTIDIPQPDAIAASADVTDAILCNGGTATVTIDANGGIAPLSYTFNGQTNTTGVFTGVAAGNNLSWSVTDANNCTAATGTLTVTQPAVLAASVSETSPITCYGENAVVRITASGGTPSYSYTFNGQTNNTGEFAGIIAGTYNWSVTDANGCTTSDNYTVAQPSQIQITQIDSNSEICQGQTLTLISSATGGTGTLRYNWTGPNGFIANNSANPSIPNATPAASGLYELTVTDANGCTETATTEVTVHATPAVTATPQNQSVCHNGPTQEIVFTGAASYTWTNNNTSIGLDASGSGNIPTFAAQNDGDTPVTATITVTPSGSGCTGNPITVTITVNPEPVMEITNSTPVLCNSGTISISLNSNVPGTTFSWSASIISGSTTGFSSGNGNIIQNTLNGAGTVRYTITPTANGCTGDPLSVDIQVISSTYNLEVVTSGPNNTEFCPGENFNINFTKSSSGQGSDQTSTGAGRRIEWQWDTRFTYTISNPSITEIASSGGPIDSPGNLNFEVVNNTDQVQTAVVTITPWSYYRERNCRWGLFTGWRCDPWPTVWDQLCSGNPYEVTITVNPFSITCVDDIVTTADTDECYATISQNAPDLSCGTGATVNWSAQGATPSSGNGGLNNVQFPIGTTTVTYEAEDNQGTQRTCSFTVTVTDDEDPQFTYCPSNINEGMDAGECGAVVTWPEPVATDNCSVGLPDRTDGTGLNSGDLFPPGTTTISYLATDASGNTATCSFDVTVAPDDEAPVFTLCPSPPQYVCAPAGGVYVHSNTEWDADAEAEDNCPGTVTLSYVLTGATTGNGTSLANVQFNIGTTTVTWTATDRSGNTSSDCSFDVVVDEAPSVEIAERNQTVCLNSPSVTFTASATGTAPFAYQWEKDGTDIPGATNATLTVSGVDASDAGSYRVTASNHCGNATSAPVTLSVSTQPVFTSQPSPQIVCFGQSAQFSAAVSGGVEPYTYVWEMRQSPSGSWTPAGGNSNILTVADAGSGDNISGAEYRVTVTDDCGNSEISSVASLTVNRIVEEDIITTTICQDENTSFSVAVSGSTPVSYQWRHNETDISNGGAYSGATSSTLTITGGQTAQNGTYSVVVTFNTTYGGGLTCQLSADIGELTVDEGPAIVATPWEQTVCPGEHFTIELSNSNGTLPTTYTWTRDNNTILFDMPSSGSGDEISGALESEDPANPQTATFYITAEANGCVTTASVTVTVVDDLPPTVAYCPPNITVNNDLGECGAVVNYEVPTFEDVCDGSGLTGELLTEDYLPGAFFPVGTTTVSWQYTDDAGNVSPVCSFDVTVTDDEPPVAVCKDITVQLDEDFVATITPADIDDGSYDNCGIDNMTIDVSEFDCTNIGTNNVTLTVTDLAGNSSSCTAVVTVADDDNPVAIDATVSQVPDPISCFGGTATVTITAIGGVGNLTYTFNGVPNSTGIFTNISAGNYSWSVIDEHGCGQTSGTYEVTEYDELSADVSATEVNCSSGNDGSITLFNFSGGTGEYEFSIDGGNTWQESPQFTGLRPGIYNVHMRDRNVPSCTMEIHTGLEVYIITATIASTDITCFDASDGTITVSNPAGGTAPYQYSADGGVTWQSTGNFTGLQPGTYNVRIMDDTGCEIILDAGVVLTQPDILAATVDFTDVSCNGAGDGTIEITSPSGGYGTGYEYSIDGGTTWQESGEFTGLTPGTYDVRIRDAGVTSCVITLDGALTISELDEITAYISSADVTCFGGSDGSITIISPSGGSGSFEYSIDGGDNWQSSTQFTGLEAGSYNVQVRDANATMCVVELDNDFEIDEGSELMIDEQPEDITACSGEDVTFTVAAFGGTGTRNFSWQTEISGVWTDLVNGGKISGVKTAVLTIANTAGTENGNYRVVVTDNCTEVTSEEVSLTINELTSLTPAGANTIICEGDDFTFEVETAGSAPLTYQWQYNSAGTWNNIGGAGGSSWQITDASPAESGDYRVVVTFAATDGGTCTLTSETRNIEVHPTPGITDLPDELDFCRNEITGAIPIDGVPAGVVFDITGGTEIGLADQTGVTSIPSFTASSSSTTHITVANVVVTPRIGDCEGDPRTIVVTVSPRPSISLHSQIAQTVCSGSATDIRFTSNAPDATFNWTVTVTPAGSVTDENGQTDAFDAANQDVTSINQILVNNTGSPATVVYVITSGLNDCYGPPRTVTITVQPEINLEINNPDDECPPNTVDITHSSVTEGSDPNLTFTYWEDEEATIPVINPAQIAAGRTYYIKGTTPERCFIIKPVEVTINPLPELDPPDDICSGEQFTYTLPSDYTWTREEIPGGSEEASGTGSIDDYISLSVDETNAVEVIYTIINEYGCEAILTVLVTPWPYLDYVNFQPSICSGERFSFDPESNPGATVMWKRDAADGISNPAVPYTTGPINEILINTTSSSVDVEYVYKLTLNNCEMEVPITVNVVPAPEVNASASVYSVCPGEAFNLFSSSPVIAPTAVTLLYEGFNGSTNNWYETHNSTGGGRFSNPDATRWSLRPNGYRINNSNPRIYSNDETQFYLSNSNGYSGTTRTTLRSPAINIQGYDIISLDFYHYFRYRGNGGAESAVVQVSPNGTSNWTTVATYNSSQGENDDFERVEIDLSNFAPNNTIYVQFVYTATQDYYWAIDNVSVKGTVPPTIEWTSEPEGFTSDVANPTGVTQSVNTTYRVKYTFPESFGFECSGIATVEVNMKDVPEIDFYADFCSDQDQGKVRLVAEGGVTGSNYVFRDSNGNIIASGINRTETLVDIIDIYSVTVTNPGAGGCSATEYLSIGTEMVVDGSFENFNPNNMTFTTHYIYEPDDPGHNTELRYGGIPPFTGGEGKYGVGTNANNYHPNFWGRDHTTGTGNFMIVNGLGSDYIVWEQIDKILIHPGVTYYFSAWMLSLNRDGNDAILQFEIQLDGHDKDQIGSEAYVQLGQTNHDNPWLPSGRFYGNWTANMITEPTLATLRIVNNRHYAPGNDFGLDDISFGTLDPFPLEIDPYQDAVCEGDDLQLYANKQFGKDPFKYIWTGPGGWTSDEENPVIPNVTQAHAGTYHLSATDGFNCGVVEAEITVRIDEAPTVDAGEDQIVCTANRDVQLDGSFTDPATSVLWTTSGDGTFDNPARPDAVYTLDPVEAYEGNTIELILTTDNPVGPCGPVSDTITITVFYSLEIEIISQDPQCHGQATGEATVNITVESTAPYTYLWSNGAITQTAGDLVAGTYDVTVTDANGCTATASVTINEPDDFITPEYTDETIHPSCLGAEDGSITISASGGTDPYMFTLIWPDGTTQVEEGITVTFENLPAGLYIIDIVDGAGCGSTSFNEPLNNPDPPVLVCPPDAEDEITDDGCSMIVAEIQDPEIIGFCEPYTIEYELDGATTGSGEGLVIDLDLYFNIGTTTVKYIVYDEIGNTAECEFDVVVKRPEIPDGIITCRDEEITLYVDEDCEAEIELDLPEIYDPCGELFTVTHDSPHITAIDEEEETATASFPVGVHTVTWTITSESGHSVVCTQTITVIDNVPPVFVNCPEEGTVYEDLITGDGCSHVPAEIPLPEISENCEIESLTYVLTGATTGSSPSAGTHYVNDANLNVGITHVVYTVTDASGNSDICEFYIWIKNVDNPRFEVNCVGIEDIVLSAVPGDCEATVTLIPPQLINVCMEDYTVSLTVENAEGVVTEILFPDPLPDPLQAVSYDFDVGENIVIWTVTDASGNEHICELTVTVTDVDSELTCPPSFDWPVDHGELFATNVPTQSPSVITGCADPQLNWELTPPAGYEDRYQPGDLAGDGFYPTGGTFWLGETVIRYYLTDASGNILYDGDDEPIECYYTILIVTEPEIECPEGITLSADDNCEYPFNPGVPVLLQGSQPLEWTWTIAWPNEETIIASGGSSTTSENPYPASIVSESPHEYYFQLGETFITWTVEDIVGNTAECTQTITVEDREPPVIGEIDDFEECVDMLYQAIWDSQDGLLRYLDHNNFDPHPYPIDRPGIEDYFLFISTSTALDIDLTEIEYSDNCCTDEDEFSIMWRIDFHDGTSIPAAAGDYISGQPSEYGSDIKLWGDRLNYASLTHTITYIIIDCNGNQSIPAEREIIIKPRPEIIKITGAP